MNRSGATMRRLWRLFLPRARITIRIVTAVVLAMSVVLLSAGAFVYWRISFALDRQLDQDLRGYTDTVVRTISTGGQLPSDDPGEVAQVYDTDGTLLAKSDAGTRRLLPRGTVMAATTTSRGLDLGRFWPAPSQTPYRVRYQRIRTTTGTVVLATAISRHKHDEALRELLGQLAIADFATVLAAAVVGWAATRAALGPVERYRRAAAASGGDPSARLPVDADRDDELTRLGITFNTLLDQIEAGHRRERQFLADASHELRSPLALLAAEVEWARHRPRSPGELDQVLLSVGDQTTRLARLADALLDLEEASDGSSLRLERVRLDVLIDDAVRPFRDPVSVQDRTFRLDAEPAEIELEPRWFELAVGNLVGNAVKHGRGEITVSAHLHGTTVRLEVLDEGDGIPAELGDAAFERFARADAARTSPGHGLGLAIVAAVARRHGGTARLVEHGVLIEIPLRG